MRSFRFLSILLGLYFFGCTTDHSLPPTLPPSPVKTAIVITVLDQDGDPVPDALVTIDQTSGFTDDLGLFFVSEVIAAQRSYVTVSKSGYFHGSRQFYPDQNSTSYVKISLIEKVNAGTISNTTGGMIQVDQKATLLFPSGAVSKSDGSPYNGPVDVKAFVISADNPEMSTLMPGRLEAKNDQGVDGVLLSYGMIAVELESPGGEELKVTEGHKVEMRMPVPSSMSNTAPAMIPMWYFDEQQGEWIHEGEAVLEGDTYVAQLGHFSFWNCDDWAESFQWEATFVEESAQPLANVQVCLTILSSNTSACDFTNNKGQVISEMPVGERFLIEVINECGAIVFSELAGPFNRITTYGPVTVNLNQGNMLMTSVTGSVINCDNQPVTNGYVVIQSAKSNSVASINPLNGTFEHRFLNCPESNARIVAIDHGSAKQSQPVSLAFTPSIDAGVLKACDVLDEYIIVQFNGYTQSYFFVPDIIVDPSDSTLYIQGINSYPSGNSISFYVYCESSGTCITWSGSGSFDLPTPEDEVTVLSLNAIIEEFGPVGGKIRGSFSGVVNGGDSGQGGPEYTNFTGSFSVNR